MSRATTSPPLSRIATATSTPRKPEAPVTVMHVNSPVNRLVTSKHWNEFDVTYSRRYGCSNETNRSLAQKDLPEAAWPPDI